MDTLDTDALLDRAVLLKAALVDYANSPGFARRVRQTMAKFAGEGTATQDHWADAVETMLYEQAAEGREPLLSRYLRTNRNIAAQDRLIYENWRDRNLFGVFRVDARRWARLLLHNLIDEMDYDVYATVGADAISVVKRGG